MKEKTIKVFECHCERCGYDWTSKLDNRKPTACPRCMMKQWWRPGRKKKPIEDVAPKEVLPTIEEASEVKLDI